MTEFTSLMDGGLSVRIGGVERKDVAYDIGRESTNQGDGEAHFTLPVSDPHDVASQYPELRHGATVAIDHTLNGVTTKIYRGFVIIDPRKAASSVTSELTVDCSGTLDVAKSRGDVGFIFTENDASQWFANKNNAKCFSTNTGNVIDIRVGDEAKVKRDVAGIIGYVPYLGADYMLEVMNGVKRITGNASYDLRDKMTAALIWASTYKTSRDISDYNIIHTWGANTRGDSKPFDYAFGGTTGAGYVALALRTNKAGGVKTTDERFITLENTVLYTDVAQKTIDQAMLAVAQFVGLSLDDYSVATIGSLLPSLLVRPQTDPSSAMATFAAQASQLVEWGYFQGQFRARPMETNPATIRALPNYHTVDPDSPDVDWDVKQHPEDGIPKAIRFLYGHTSKKTKWPAGTPASCIGEADPGWTSGVPFMGTTAPVIPVDFSRHNYTDAKAQSMANQLAQHLGVALSGGEVHITEPTLSDGTPAPYLQGGDWIEGEGTDDGPLYVTKSNLDFNTGYIDLELGLSRDLLIEQLEAAGGGINALALHKPYRKKR